MHSIQAKKLKWFDSLLHSQFEQLQGKQVHSSQRPSTEQASQTHSQLVFKSFIVSNIQKILQVWILYNKVWFNLKEDAPKTN